MNGTQKQIVGWGLALFVAMVVFPPWANQGLGANRGSGKVQYSFLFDAPSGGLFKDPHTNKWLEDR